MQWAQTLDSDAEVTEDTTKNWKKDLILHKNELITTFGCWNNNADSNDFETLDMTVAFNRDFTTSNPEEDAQFVVNSIKADYY